MALKSTRKKPRSGKTAAKKTAAKARAPRKAAATPSKAASRKLSRKPPAKKALETATATVAVPHHRAIFIDAENTSSENDLQRVLEFLNVDRSAQPTTLTAAGNWRAIGSGAARLLARHGAELVHSAPSPGVRDWSDLWIAVAAGRWLAQAKPGDRLEIVSDDRAFDAVIQAAAALGVEFHRISYRSIPGVSGTATHSASAHTDTERRPRRRGGRRRHRGTGSASPGTTASTPVHSPAAPAARPAVAAPVAAELDASGEPHAAPHEQVRSTLSRLVGGSTEKWINLDLLANALRNEGFNRPPGSPRLVTRLRHMKGIEISPSGMVRLRDDEGETPSAPEAPAAEETSTGTETAPRPRRRRRRGRGGSKAKAAADNASNGEQD